MLQSVSSALRTCPWIFRRRTRSENNQIFLSLGIGFAIRKKVVKVIKLVYQWLFYFTCNEKLQNNNNNSYCRVREYSVAVAVSVAVSVIAAAVIIVPLMYLISRSELHNWHQMQFNSRRTLATALLVFLFCCSSSNRNSMNNKNWIVMHIYGQFLFLTGKIFIIFTFIRKLWIWLVLSLSQSLLLPSLLSWKFRVEDSYFKGFFYMSFICFSAVAANNS